MSRDTMTLSLVATLVSAMIGLMLLFFGRLEKIAALNWWGAAYLLGAASIAAKRAGRNRVEVEVDTSPGVANGKRVHMAQAREPSVVRRAPRSVICGCDSCGG